MVLAKIISVPEDAINLSSNQLDMYSKRRQRISTELMPLLSHAGIYCETFRAITPDDIYIEKDIVHYRNQLFTIGSNRDGRKATEYELVLALGHYELWKYCAESGAPLLILEDDAYIKPENLSCIANSIAKFALRSHRFARNGILYLQSTCPWRPGKPIKVYPNEQLMLIEEDFYWLSRRCNDISGTTAYLVTPTSSKALISYISRTPLWALDGMIHNALRDGTIDVYLPLYYDRLFNLADQPI